MDNKNNQTDTPIQMIFIPRKEEYSKDYHSKEIKKPHQTPQACDWLGGHFKYSSLFAFIQLQVSLFLPTSCSR